MRKRYMSRRYYQRGDVVRRLRDNGQRGKVVEVFERDGFDGPSALVLWDRTTEQNVLTAELRRVTR
jgi:hypothetical protein